MEIINIEVLTCYSLDILSIEHKLKCWNIKPN